MSQEIVIHVSKDKRLPDNRDYTNRFEIPSSSSNRDYVVAQHKQKRHWSCDCPGWKHWRHCHHLDAMSLPGHCTPYEAVLNA